MLVFTEKHFGEQASNIVVEVPAQVQLQKDKEWLVVVCFVVAPQCTTLRQKIMWYTNQIRNTRLDDSDAKATKRCGRGYVARLVAA